MEDGESLISISIVNGDPKRQAAPAQPLTPGKKRQFSPDTAPRTALVFIAGHTGQRVKALFRGRRGLGPDIFSHQAVATHLNAVGEPLVKAFGAAPPYAVFSDSLETYGAD